MGFEILWGETLPCMPSVLLSALEACLEEPADVSRVVHWIKQDVVTCAHVLDCLCDNTANSGTESRAPEILTGEIVESISLEQSLADVDIETLRSWLLQLATQQISMRFEESDWGRFKAQWRRSLYSARIAKSLALLTGHQNADECYQAALLQDIGQLMQQARYHQSYRALQESASGDAELLRMERERLGSDHCQLAGETADKRGWPAALSDAIRFHHEPLDDILDAQHQIKIVNVASLLSAKDFSAESPEFTAIESLLGIQKPLLLELLTQLATELDNLLLELLPGERADDLSIAASGHKTANIAGLEKSDDQGWETELVAQRQLAHRVAEHMHCQGLLNKILAAGDEAQLQSRWLQSLCELHNATKGMLFIFDSENNRLEYRANINSKVKFSIVAETARSIVSDTFCLREAIAYSPEQPAERHLTVVDRQISHQLGGGAVWYVPLLVQGYCIGVAAFAISESKLAHLQSSSSRVVAFVSTLSAAIPLVRQRLSAAEQGQFLQQQQFQKNIREVLHEVNNPLAIVSNYLQTIRFKRPDDVDVQTDIDKITAELQRASTLLEKFKAPTGGLDEEPHGDVRKVIRESAELIEQGLLDDRGIALRLELDEGLAGFQLRQLPLQQILTNLLKNAAEALPAGGSISLSAKPMRSDGQHRYVELDIIDDGPGLPDQVQRRLFQSVASSKVGHAGLGLQIVKRLVDELHGMIFCRSSSVNASSSPSVKAGTHFQILLPVFFQSSKNEDESQMRLNHD